MATAQDSPRIFKLKARRTKQLAAWRVKQAAKLATAGADTTTKAK